jgi:replicative DNA helicase
MNAATPLVPTSSHPPANLSYYMDIIQEKYLLRNMIRVCTDVVGRVYEVDALMDEGHRQSISLRENGSPSKPRGYAGF